MPPIAIAAKESLPFQVTCPRRSRSSERDWTLFIDLIWVGIIGNLSEVYSTLEFKPGGARPGFATMVFILVFLPSWRIWNAMREFWNNYYMDDLTQRLFTFWVLFCSVFYGNQLAYLTEDINQVKQIVILTYLVILGSFLIIEVVYSFYIPWLRRLVAFQTMIRMPSVALWIVAIYLPGIRAIGPIMAGTFWEYFCPIVLDSPLAERFTSSEYRKVLDVHHFQSRMANFFVIVLGEGVLQLVKDGPLGFGLNFTTGTMAFALLIYVLLSFLYFNRDGSKNFIPAVERKGWVILIWVFWHIPLFSTILTFAPSLMFIIRHQADEPYNHTSQERLTQKEIESYTHNALWSVSVSLGIFIASMTALALLDKSLDGQAILKVNNRYVRLSGRFSYFAIIICIPATPKISTNLFLVIGGLLLVFLTMWEWNSSMDKDGKFIEPKGLTMMMSHELKGKHLSSRAQS